MASTLSIRSSLRRGPRLALAASGIAVALFAGLTQSAFATHAPSGVTVSGLNVKAAAFKPNTPITVRFTVAAHPQIRVTSLVVAVRDSSGNNYDFPLLSNVTLTGYGQSIVQSRTFPHTGTYRYFVAYYSNKAWTNLQPQQTFSLTNTAAAPATSTTIATPTKPSTPVATAPQPVTPVATVPTAASSTAPAGYATLAFDDEFNGTSVDWNKWSDSSSAEADNGHGNKGNQQLEWNSSKNCSVTNGLLTITAKPDNITSPSGQHYDWSSCLLSSSPSFAFQYGDIQISAKMPAQAGFWPGFWTWQAASNNTWTETDAYEYYSDNPTKLYLTQHSGAQGACQITPSFNPSSGFHTYGAAITPSGTDFSIDGKTVCHANGTATGLTNLMIDMFVYSQIPPAAGTVATNQIDWVKVWK